MTPKQAKASGLRITKESIARKEAQREAMKAAREAEVPGTAVLSNHQITTKTTPKYQKLFQDNPDEKCT